MCGGKKKKSDIASIASGDQNDPLLKDKTPAEVAKLEEELEYLRFPSIMGWYFDGSQFATDPFAMNEEWATYFNNLQEDMDAIEEYEHEETFTEQARRNFWPPKWLGFVFRTRGVYLDMKDIKKDPPRQPPEFNFEHERNIISILLADRESSSEDDHGFVPKSMLDGTEDVVSLSSRQRKIRIQSKNPLEFGDEELLLPQLSVASIITTGTAMATPEPEPTQPTEKKKKPKKDKNAAAKDGESGGKGAKEQGETDKSKTKTKKNKKKDTKKAEPEVKEEPAAAAEPSTSKKPKRAKSTFKKKEWNNETDEGEKIAWTDPRYKESDQRVRLDRKNEDLDGFFSSGGPGGGGGGNA